MPPFPFNNIEFFVVLVPVIVLVLAARRLGGGAHTWAVVLASVALFVWLPGLTAAYVALFAVLVLLMWFAANARSSSHPAAISGLAAGIVLVAFVWFRLDAAGWLPRRESALSLLPAFGFAFFVVKAIGLVSDVIAGRVQSATLGEVIAYFLFFPTLIAGPIFRYGDFVTQLRASVALRNDFGRIAASAPRLLVGAFKVMVVAALLEPLSIHALSPDDIANSGRSVYLGALAYYFFEYINFSGYSDMAIATCGMLGLSAPENFNFPFLARNLTELWRRWHMSFAFWLRDYIYFPINFRLAMRFRASKKRERTLCAAAAIFLTFVLCGAWHGFTPGPLLFGVLSGVVLGLEAMAAGFGWKNDYQVSLRSTAAGRVVDDTVRQIWTLHVAAMTFAPVLLTTDQLHGVLRLIRRVT
jgi:alginate O-acetyltransferase complex protein AlgI